MLIHDKFSQPLGLMLNGCQLPTLRARHRAAGGPSGAGLDPSIFLRPGPDGLGWYVAA
jgi:hypothetical protein